VAGMGLEMMLMTAVAFLGFVALFVVERLSRG
jgi:hypothetical protein